ncbi:glycosyltransferase family 4 protein [Pedobacter metabolipauper]|uniref:Glycosyltransferase involved in cell wall biosynthesis n=1 Tax=Pedobacter metabolipauper TaxID=425513 RepID=A0A4R6SX62_9SPHI|nr:glycosyltransferase family 1 protein [Pedobacter metabolipauper]TDQ10016.1 glycosyltransferase involved in cell wall biosynthesis [Pedobacter metabolipauper]
MDRIRVAFFAEILIEDFDGASRTMFQLIDRICSNSFDFLFICGTGPDQLGDFKCLKVPAVSTPVNKKYKIALPGFSKKHISSQLKDFNPHVIHIATPSMLGHFGLKYAKLHSIPVITIYHTHFVSYIDYYFKHLPFLIKPIKQNITAVQNKFYNECDKVYVPSTSIASELMASGIDGNRLVIWKRGINTSLFSPLKKDTDYMERLTGNRMPSVLFASRLVWEKNLELLIGIYALMEQQKLPFNLIIAGDGDARKACQQRMPNAVFTGNLSHSDLSVLYASASVFVFPSNTETFGNVVLEAMASGTPCVIADAGGSKDFITNGINGFKCSVSTLDSAYVFLDKIKLVINDPHLRAELSANGLQFCRSYDWTALADTYFKDLTGLTGLHTIHDLHKNALENVENVENTENFERVEKNIEHINVI